MHQHERASELADGRHRAPHGGEVVHPRREHHGPPLPRDVAQERDVVAFAGADLEPHDVERLQPIRRFARERGAEEHHALALAVLLDPPLLVRAQLAALDDVPEPLVADLAGPHVRLDHLGLGDVALELHALRAGLDRGVDERQRLADVPFVVDADFRDHERRVLLADLAPPELELSHDSAPVGVAGAAGRGWWSRAARATAREAAASRSPTAGGSRPARHARKCAISARYMSLRSNGSWLVRVHALARAS